MEANHGHGWDRDSEGPGTGRSSPQVGEFDHDEAGPASSASVRYTRLTSIPQPALPTAGLGEIPVARHTAQVRDFILLHDHDCSNFIQDVCQAHEDHVPTY
jgi:hypothetical protein